MTQTDKYGQHEALHMTNFLMNAVASELMDHGAIKSDSALSAKAAIAHQVLFDLYQMLGAKVL